VALNPPF
jgi:NIMA (never in mitosis gene a)-related kinase 1/4/5